MFTSPARCFYSSQSEILLLVRHHELYSQLARMKISLPDARCLILKTHRIKTTMNNIVGKLVLFGLLLMLLLAPFAGVAPLMLVLLGFGFFWIISSLVQEFFTSDIEEEDKKA